MKKTDSNKVMKRFTPHSFFPIFNSTLFLCFFAIMSILLPACKSKPPLKEVPPPKAFLVFKRIEASNPENYRLLFELETSGPELPAGKVKINSWSVNNYPAETKGFSLDIPLENGFPANSKTPITLNMDIAALTANGLAPRDYYDITLNTELVFFSDSAPAATLEVSGNAGFPGIQAPEFSITSIAVIKAELVNTLFRITMNINNPNPFPMIFSAFNYELYGNGRLWANGTESSIITFPAKSSGTAKLHLIMNFINMDRDLLNQVANLINVDYRFYGEAQISSEIDYLPAFITRFNLSGLSQVFEK